MARLESRHLAIGTALLYGLESRHLAIQATATRASLWSECIALLQATDTRDAQSRHAPSKQPQSPRPAGKDREKEREGGGERELQPRYPRASTASGSTRTAAAAPPHPPRRCTVETPRPAAPAQSPAAPSTRSQPLRLSRKTIPNTQHTGRHARHGPARKTRAGATSSESGSLSKAHCRSCQVRYLHVTLPGCHVTRMPRYPRV